MKAVKKPILRYHGGKWRIAPWIISHFPKHETYVEPFCGAASVLLRKEPSYCEVINDKFDRITNLFRQLRDRTAADQLKELLQLTPYSENEYRMALEVSENPIEDARRMLILGRQCHGSTGASGGKLTGWRRRPPGNGASDSREWADFWRHIDSYVARLASVYVESDDAANVMHRWDSPTTLHYVDPPYLRETRSMSTSDNGYAHEMTESEHRELALNLHTLRGMVILSGYRSALYDELFGDWRRVEISTKCDSRADRTECLWLNPEVDFDNRQSAGEKAPAGTKWCCPECGSENIEVALGRWFECLCCGKSDDGWPAQSESEPEGVVEK